MHSGIHPTSSNNLFGSRIKEHLTVVEMYVYSGTSDQSHNLSSENYQINFTFLQDGGLSMTSNLGSKKRKKS